MYPHRDNFGATVPSACILAHGFPTDEDSESEGDGDGSGSGGDGYGGGGGGGGDAAWLASPTGIAGDRDAVAADVAVVGERMDLGSALTDEDDL